MDSYKQTTCSHYNSFYIDFSVRTTSFTFISISLITSSSLISTLDNRTNQSPLNLYHCPFHSSRIILLNSLKLVSGTVIIGFSFRALLSTCKPQDQVYGQVSSFLICIFFVFLYLKLEFLNLFYSFLLLMR